MKKSSIALAIATVLTVGASQAADITVAVGAATKFTTATIAANSTEVVRNAAVVLTIPAVAAAKAVNVDDILTLELTGGAAFDAATLAAELAAATFLQEDGG
jgi:uncharacterized ferredoxin-like protein